MQAADLVAFLRDQVAIAKLQLGFELLVCTSAVDSNAAVQVL